MGDRCDWSAVMIEFHLPIPPSRNKVEKAHPIHTHKAKRKYQRAAWAAAVSQHKPFRDPPEQMMIKCHFRLYGPLRDEDGLDVKWVLDALRQHQVGNQRWRRGLYTECGYFVDDSPRHLIVSKSTQEIDRSVRKDRGLRVRLEVFRP